MTPEDMKKRTKAFALRVIRLLESLPDLRTSRVIANQLLRSATSVGANYRAACGAKSQADFIAKMGIVQEEADECLYWMELLTEAKIVSEPMISALMDEGKQILAITISSINTARGRKRDRANR